MERAEALEAASPWLEGNVVRNETDDVACIPDRRDKILRKRDGQWGHLPRPDRGGFGTAPVRKKIYPLPLRSCAKRFNNFLRAASAFLFFLTLGFS